MLPEWIFTQYRRSRTHKGVIIEWYSNATSEQKAEFSVVMRILNQRARADWSKPAQSPRYRPLSNELHGYGEIRFFAGRVNHRPIGYFSGKNEFTILTFAIEKGNKFIPKTKTLKKILEERRNQIESNKKEHTDGWQIH